MLHKKELLDNMIFSALSVFSVVAFGLCAAEKLHLPVPTCKRDSNNYNSCLKDAITEAWPLFVKGLPEFDFPPLDPYFYAYQEGVFDSGDFHAELRGINNTIEGLRNMRIKEVRPHFIDDMFRLEIDVRVSKIFINGIINGNGSFSGIHVGAKTNYNLTVEGIKSTWDISGPVKNDTWIIEHFRLTLFYRNFKIFINDLSQGNREINELAMMFVNEYWPQLSRILLPQAVKYWDVYNSDILTRFFAKLSFSEVFP